ncbi:MAG: S1 family peptidase [Lachnospiraceae bacterium]|nr:S1 family peptidase [Lachnospiraceae bacterium]
MKIFRRVVVCLAVVSFFVMMVSVMPTKAASEEEMMSLSEEKVKARMDAQVDALGAYQKLFDTFGRNEDGSLLYPEDYAGAYIEGDRLVVMLTQMDEQTKIKYNMIYPEYVSAVIYQEAEYTLNQLYKIQEIGHELMTDFSITSYGVDEKNNETFIQVPEEEVEELTQTINGMRLSSFPVKVEESIGENIPTAAISLEGGSAISMEPGKFASICIGGTYLGKNAILTCGHDMKDKNPIHLGGIYLSGPQIGEIAYVRCNPYGTVNPGKNALGDFSIVLLNQYYAPTNKMKAENSVVSATGTYSSVPVGTSIYKYGAKTGYSYGEVTRTNVTVVYEKTELEGNIKEKVSEVSGLTQSYMLNTAGTNAIDEGDSGGCVYTKSGSNYMICGDVSGLENIIDMVHHFMYFSPIYYAIDEGFQPKVN